MKEFQKTSVFKVEIPSAESYLSVISTVPGIPMESGYLCWLKDRHDRRADAIGFNGDVEKERVNVADPQIGVRPFVHLDINKAICVPGEKAVIGDTQFTAVSAGTLFSDEVICRHRYSLNEQDGTYEDSELKKFLESSTFIALL